MSNRRTTDQHKSASSKFAVTPENKILGESALAPKMRVFQRLVIEYVSTEAIKPSPHRTKKSSAQQIDCVGACLARFGMTLPLVVNQHDRLIAGHAVWMAAKKIGMQEVPIVRRGDLSEDEARALALALNKLAEMSSWDEEVLQIELPYLLSIESSLDFSMHDIGFLTAEVDRIVGLPPGANPEEPLPKITPDTEAISCLGDMWHLGHHRLLCGDATQEASYLQIMGAERAQLVLSDPPYNRRGRDISTRGEHGTFVEGSGEMSSAEFTQFLSTTFKFFARYSADGALALTFMDWRHMREMLDAGESAFAELKCLIVWGKDVPALGSLWKSQHELIFAWKNGTAPHINNVELGRHGRNRGNLWLYPGANSSRDPALKWHPTPKNVDLLVEAMLDCSHRNGIVLDGFLGSGATLVAAEQCGRRCYGIELNPHYVDQIIRRWEALTGQQAIHAATGLTFAALAEQRRREGDPEACPTPEPTPPLSPAGEKRNSPVIHVRQRAEAA
jgi:hypothetical protein